jgi:hypothetical protein
VPSRRLVRLWAVRAAPLRLFYPGSPPGLSPVPFRSFQTSRLHLPAPLRSPALPGFNATMRALTAARGRGFRFMRPSTGTPCDRPRGSLRFTYHTFRTLRLQSPHRSTRSLCHLSCQRRGLPVCLGSGLRHSTGGSPDGTAESSSSSYGLPVRLALLPTPPRDDAVTVGYRSETGIPEGDFHLSAVIRLRTHDGRQEVGTDGSHGTQDWDANSDRDPLTGGHKASGKPFMSIRNF